MPFPVPPLLLDSISPSLRRAGGAPPMGLVEGKRLCAMEFQDIVLKKAAIDGRRQLSPLKQGLALLCSSPKYGDLLFCSFPMPLSLGPGFNSIPEERVVLGRLCVLGELEKAPSDGIAKGCSGTASLPGCV